MGRRSGLVDLPGLRRLEDGLRGSGIETLSRDLTRLFSRGPVRQLAYGKDGHL